MPLVLLALGCSRTVGEYGDPSATAQQPNAPFVGDHPPGIPGAAQVPTGLLLNDARAFRGYTLIAPVTSKTTTLIDTESKVVRTWNSDYMPALGACLLNNGNLLRAGVLPESERPFGISGAGGLVQEFTWGGELVWDYRYGDARRLPHHDVLKLPNGNVLLVVCERIPAQEAVAVGRRPNTFSGDYFLTDCLVEIKPTGRTTGEVVWEWRVWDHLVQESDRAKPNYGSAAEHPELIDVNHGAGASGPVAQGADLAKLQALGYVGASGTTPDAPGNADWTHINSVAYNSQLDQFALTGLGFNEIWIVDHSTTRTEAAGHTGGRRGKGGDLLYRWGNPRAYRHGTSADQRLFGPHNVQWIEPGLPGEGNLLIFNNGVGRMGGNFSSVDEIVPPIDSEGRYNRKAKSAFGPDKAVWSYTGEKKFDFFSFAFSGAQRLPNGNTLTCLGLSGTVIEVTREGTAVWKYTVPYEGPPPPDIPLPVVPVPPGAPMDPMFQPPNLRPPQAGNELFRATRYAPDFSGFARRNLTPR